MIFRATHDNNNNSERLSVVLRNLFNIEHKYLSLSSYTFGWISRRHDEYTRVLHFALYASIQVNKYLSN